MHTVRFLTHIVENHQVLVYFFIFFGLVFEGDVVLIITGIFAHLGAINLYLALIFILLGGLGKTLLGYSIGTFVHKKWNHTKFLKYIEKHVLHIMPNFRQKPFLSIFISKFITGANQFFIVFAGYQKIDFRKYLRTEIASTLIWAPGMLLLGYLFSYAAFRISHQIWKFSSVVLVLIVLYIVLDRLVAWAYEIFEEFYDN